MAKSRGEVIGGITGVVIGVLLVLFLASKVFDWLASTPPAKVPGVNSSTCVSSGSFDPAHLGASCGP